MFNIYIYIGKQSAYMCEKKSVCIYLYNIQHIYLQIDIDIYRYLYHYIQVNKKIFIYFSRNIEYCDIRVLCVVQYSRRSTI